MKMIKNNRGLTLTELIVSTVLIGIVMLGVAAFSFGIKSIQDATSNGAILVTRTTATMSQFHKYGSQAIGWQGNPGIRVLGWDDPWALPAPANSPWISFRNDTNSTPDIYTDDTWFIFIFNAADHSLRRCKQTLNQGTAGDGSDDHIPNETGNCSENNSTYLSTSVDNATFELYIDSTVTVLEFYVEITLESVFDPDKAIDPVTNPEYNLTTRLSPVAHSW